MEHLLFEFARYTPLYFCFTADFREERAKIHRGAGMVRGDERRKQPFKLAFNAVFWTSEALFCADKPS
jgi:hypothetical protein